MGGEGEKGAGEEGESVSRASLHYISLLYTCQNHVEASLQIMDFFSIFRDTRLLNSDRSNFDREP